MPVPITVLSLRNVTEPVGELPELLDTYALKVTFCPGVLGFGDVLSEVVVGDTVTVKVAGADVELPVVPVLTRLTLTLPAVATVGDGKDTEQLPLLAHCAEDATTPFTSTVWSEPL